jgi:ATPase family AAA domain-containing protein 3A/B
MMSLIPPPLPGPQERFQLIKIYFDKYITSKKEWADKEKPKFVALFKKEQQRIFVKGIDDELIRVAAEKTEGFLDADLFMQIVDYKINDHKKCIRLEI